jgi:tripartite ATP-independent transporter DctP family solute receptor
MKKLSFFLALILAAGTLFAAPAQDSGGAKVVLKWGDVVAGNHPSVQMIDRVAADVAQRTNGRVTINAFPGGQLGSSRDQIEAVFTGTQDIVTEGSATFGQWVPSIGVTESPYIWRDMDHLVNVMTGPIAEEFNKELIAKRNMRILGATYYGTRHITTTNRRVEKVADMNGLKFRVPETDIFRAMAEAWGAKPTPMSLNELYLALQQSVVDAQENPLPTIDNSKFQEIQKYLILTGHIITPRLVVINEGVFQKISPEDQKSLIEAVRAGILWQNAELRRQELTLLDTFKAAGMTVIEPDVAEFRRVVLDVVPKMFESRWGAGMWEKISSAR